MEGKTRRKRGEGGGLETDLMNASHYELQGSLGLSAHTREQWWFLCMLELGRHRGLTNSGDGNTSATTEARMSSTL